jgi:hypothetical protein
VAGRAPSDRVTSPGGVGNNTINGKRHDFIQVPHALKYAYIKTEASFIVAIYKEISLRSYLA